jgi:hypothetical protein
VPGKPRPNGPTTPRRPMPRKGLPRKRFA